MLHRFRFLEYVFDRAAIEESHLRDIVHLAVQDHFEAFDRLCDRNILARNAGKVFRYVERLGQEFLNLSRTVYDLLVLFIQLFHTEDRDDILQFIVPLQRFLHRGAATS